MVLDGKPSGSWIWVSRSNFYNLLKTDHAHLCQYCKQLLRENDCVVRTENHDLDPIVEKNNIWIMCYLRGMLFFNLQF